MNCLPRLLGIFGCIGLLQIGSIARAQESPGEALAEITVTAQKRVQSLQSVGTSITALDSSALNKVGLTDVTSVASQTPGMQYNQSATVTVYNLRGVSQNDFSDHQEAPIAVYADDAYVAAMGALQGTMYDLQRVEVLRGPQGTLFGRNATGGLIHYISEKPKFDTEITGSVTGGNFGTVSSDGVVNMAVNDQLAVRLSLATDRHNGYVDNRTGPDLGDEDQYAARLQVLYKPNERAEIILKLHGLTNNNEHPGNYSWAASHPDATGRGVLIGPDSTANCPNFSGGCVPGGDLFGYRNPGISPFDQAFDRPTVFNRTVGGATLHVTWNLDQFTVSSVTDYLRLQKRYGEDSDISPLPNFTYDTFQHYHQISQELHLNGEIDHFRWITGLYFLSYHTRSDVVVDILPAAGGPSQNSFRLTTQSESAFGQVEYDFSPRLTGIIGARATSDQKTFDYIYLNAPQSPVIYNDQVDPTAKHTYNNGTGKIELDYHFTGDVMAYASVNRGAKGGGWSAPVSGVVDPAALPYKQEILTSYEAGEKAQLWDGRVRLNGSVFYYGYQNYQGFFLQGLTQVVQNVDATVKGGELELTMAPAKGMNLQLGVSHIESRAKHVPLPAGGFTDTYLPQAPRWSLNGVARYEWPALAGRLAVEADAKWNGQQYIELLNASGDREPAYIVSNARVSYYSGDDHWDVSAWVKNLADRWYREYSLDLSGLGYEQSIYGMPRTFGATVNYRWSP